MMMMMMMMLMMMIKAAAAAAAAAALKPKFSQDAHMGAMCNTLAEACWLSGLVARRDGNLVSYLRKHCPCLNGMQRGGLAVSNLEGQELEQPNEYFECIFGFVAHRSTSAQ